MSTFILEHCEPKLYEWSFIEYKHISKIVGKNNLWFTNTQSSRLKDFGKTFSTSVTKMDLAKACILDPNATKQLAPSDTKKFDYFIFGGILGDNPPTDKTKQLITSKVKWEARHLGKEQMATDNAVYVAKKILDGTPLEKIKFVQDIEIDIREGESVLLPYKYVLVNGKPLVCDALIEKLKKQKGF